METYGICLEEAMGGRYSAPFVASLCEQMPQSCRWRVSYDTDAWWDGDRLLTASLINHLRDLMWGLSDKKKRGPRPRPIGPRRLLRDKGRTIPAIAMTREDLMAELAKPRTEVDDG